MKRSNSDSGIEVNLNQCNVLNDKVKDMKGIEKVKSANANVIIEIMKKKRAAAEENHNVEVTTVDTLEKLLQLTNKDHIIEQNKLER